MNDQSDYNQLFEDISTSEIAKLYKELLSDSSGARFFRADLHVHSPASTDYKEKRYANDLTDELRYLNILHKSKELGLDIIAITDHNTIEGYKKLRELVHTRGWRNDFRDLAILFGVEITVEAGRYVHLTAYFDEQTPVKDVERLLIRIGIDTPGDERDWAKTIKLDQLIRKISEMGGIAIPAHVDSTAGILEEMKRGLPLARILTLPEVMAVGITKEKTISYLEKLFHEDSNFRRTDPMAYITGSDAHALCKIESADNNDQFEIIDRGIGNLITYIKANEPSFQSFKYALQCPATRIRHSPPQVLQYPKIIGMAILGGYLGDENDWRYFRFNDALNCIIGGRGTGKSTILKVLQSLSLVLSGEQPNDWYLDIKYAFSKACIFVDTGNGHIYAVATCIRSKANI